MGFELNPWAPLSVEIELSEEFEDSTTALFEDDECFL